MISPRLLLFLLILTVAVFLIRRAYLRSGSKAGLPKLLERRFGKKTREMWVQVYDTDSLEEAESIQVRLEEEDLDCLIYEQGRKDVHGNSLKGFGIAVPRTSVPRAQNIIARMPA